MKPLTLLLLTICTLTSTTTAAINGRCTTGQPIGLEGVCVSTTKCRASGGRYVNNRCPNDPANIKCCYKNSCSPYGEVLVRGVVPIPRFGTCVPVRRGLRAALIEEGRTCSHLG